MSLKTNDFHNGPLIASTFMGHYIGTIKHNDPTHKSTRSITMIHPDRQFIEGIKTLRTWCYETFGITPSLLVAKNLVDELRQAYRSNRTKELNQFLDDTGIELVEEVIRDRKKAEGGF
jgi:hypothetical protein